MPLPKTPAAEVCQEHRGLPANAQGSASIIFAQWNSSCLSAKTLLTFCIPVHYIYLCEFYWRKSQPHATFPSKPISLPPLLVWNTNCRFKPNAGYQSPDHYFNQTGSLELLEWSVWKKNPEEQSKNIVAVGQRPRLTQLVQVCAWK